MSRPASSLVDLDPTEAHADLRGACSITTCQAALDAEVARVLLTLRSRRARSTRPDGADPVLAEPNHTQARREIEEASARSSQATRPRSRRSDAALQSNAAQIERAQADASAAASEKHKTVENAL